MKPVLIGVLSVLARLMSSAAKNWNGVFTPARVHHDVYVDLFRTNASIRPFWT